jgi:hypothetical protein
MAEADQIAKDIVVAWLAHNELPRNANNPPAKVGAEIAEIYKLVLQAVRQDIESRPAPEPLSPPSVEGELGETAS